MANKSPAEIIGEKIKKAYLISFYEALDVGLVDIEFLKKLNRFYFSFFVCHFNSPL